MALITKPSELRPADFGIDMVECRFPVAKPNFKDSSWAVTTKRLESGTRIRSGNLQIGSPPNSTRLWVSRDRDGTHRCTAHFNPARFVDPLGIGLCRPRDLHLVAESIMDRVCRYVTPLSATEDFQLRRLDIACNFYNIKEPGRYLRGLSQACRPYSKQTTMHFGGGNRAQSLQSGSKSGGLVRLYDKHEQAGGLIRPGTMRAELEARRPWLDAHGAMYSMRDITQATARQLFENRVVSWFGLEREVMDFDGLTARVLEGDLSPTLTTNLLRFVLKVAKGSDPQCSSKSQNEYQKVLLSLGVAGCDLQTSISASSRLDVRTHSEVWTGLPPTASSHGAEILSHHPSHVATK